MVKNVILVHCLAIRIIYSYVSKNAFRYYNALPTVCAHGRGSVVMPKYVCGNKNYVQRKAMELNNTARNKSRTVCME